MCIICTPSVFNTSIFTFFNREHKPYFVDISDIILAWIIYYGIQIFRYWLHSCKLSQFIKYIKSRSTALKQTMCYICIFVNMERVLLMPCFLGEEKLYRSMTKRFRNMNMNWQGPMLWMWRITMVIYCGGKKTGEERKWTGHLQGHLSVITLRATRGKNTAKAKRE